MPYKTLNNMALSDDEIQITQVRQEESMHDAVLFPLHRIRKLIMLFGHLVMTSLVTWLR